MSGFVLQFNRNAFPIDPAALEAAGSRLQHRDLHGSRLFHKAHLGIVFKHFWSGKREHNLHQPLHHETGAIHFLFDGRLDNRDEIITALGATSSLAKLSDSQLAFEYLSHRGLDKVADLVGPYAMIYLDMVNGSVWVARDPVGNRTVYYYADSNTLLLGSEEQALLPLLRTHSLDPIATAHFFALAPCGERTFFSEIKELQPGWVLACEGRSIKNFPFAFQEDRNPVPMNEPHEVVELMERTLAKAVASRISADLPTAIMLSGGTDSSTIAALGHHALSSSISGSQIETLKPLSYSFHQYPNADESPEIRQICKILGLKFRGFDASTMSPFEYWKSSLPNPNTPEDNLYRPLLQKLYAMAAEHGCQVLLSGDFGDNHFAGSHRWLWEAISKGKWHHAISNFKSDFQMHGLRTSLRRCGFGSKKHLRLPTQPPHYLTSHASSLWDTSAVSQSFPKGISLRQASLQNPLAARSFSREHYYAYLAGIELRHPYRDRNLIALSLTLPAYFLYRHGQKKWWLRQIRNQYLPPNSCPPPSTKNLEPFYQASFNRDRPLILKALKDSEPIWSPWVIPQQVYQSVADPERSNAPRLLWWHCLSFSRWHRHVF